MVASRARIAGVRTWLLPVRAHRRARFEAADHELPSTAQDGESLGLRSVPALQHAHDGGFEVVVTHSPREDAAEVLESQHMPFQERLLSLGAERDMERPPRVGQPHHEHPALDPDPRGPRSALEARLGPGKVFNEKAARRLRKVSLCSSRVPPPARIPSHRPFTGPGHCTEMIPHEVRGQHATYPALVTPAHPDSQGQAPVASRHRNSCPILMRLRRDILSYPTVSMCE